MVVRLFERRSRSAAAGEHSALTETSNEVREPAAAASRHKQADSLHGNVSQYERRTVRENL